MKVKKYKNDCLHSILYMETCNLKYDVVWLMLFGFREFNMRQLSSLEITGATGLGNTYKGGKLLLTLHGHEKNPGN